MLNTLILKFLRVNTHTRKKPKKIVRTIKEHPFGKKTSLTKVEYEKFSSQTEIVDQLIFNVSKYKKLEGLKC
jgi:hypothetical protein